MSFRFDQCGLVYRSRAAFHFLQCPRSSARPGQVLRYQDDIETLVVSEMIQIRLLMFEAECPEQVNSRVIEEWLTNLSGALRTLKRRDMRTGEKVC